MVHKPIGADDVTGELPAEVETHIADVIDAAPVGVATAASIAAEAALARNADNLTSGTVADARIAATIARDSEVTAAVAAEATLARNADNLTSGTVADARIAATIARDSEVAAGYQPLDADLTTIAGLTATTDNIMQAKSGAWASRTLAQLWADLKDLTVTLTNKTIALGSNTVSGTLAQFNTAVTDADLASLAGSETLTNKTVALGSNTVSGTTAQFNTALTDNDFATLAGAETLTNKRVQKRVVTTASTATLTIDSDSYDGAKVTAQAAGLTIANPTGTPSNMQGLIIRIKDNGTARALSWGAQFRVIGVTLPTTTVISKTVYVGCAWNNDDTKWDVIAVAQEA